MMANSDTRKAFEMMKDCPHEMLRDIAEMYQKYPDRAPHVFKFGITAEELERRSNSPDEATRVNRIIDDNAVITESDRGRRKSSNTVRKSAKGKKYIDDPGNSIGWYREKNKILETTIDPFAGGESTSSSRDNSPGSTRPNSELALRREEIAVGAIKKGIQPRVKSKSGGKERGGQFELRYMSDGANNDREKISRRERKTNEVDRIRGYNTDDFLLVKRKYEHIVNEKQNRQSNSGANKSQNSRVAESANTEVKKDRPSSRQSSIESIKTRKVSEKNTFQPKCESSPRVDETEEYESESEVEYITTRKYNEKRMIESMKMARIEEAIMTLIENQSRLSEKVSEGDNRRAEKENGQKGDTPAAVSAPMTKESEYSRDTRYSVTNSPVLVSTSKQQESQSAQQTVDKENQRMLIETSQHARYESDRNLAFNLKLIPKFDGSPENLQSFTDYIITMEERYPNNNFEILNACINKLEGQAATEFGGKIRQLKTSQHFRRELTSRFTSLAAAHKLRASIPELRQTQGEAMFSYRARTMNLHDKLMNIYATVKGLEEDLKKANMKAAREEIRLQFIMGLAYPYGMMIAAEKPKTLEEALEMASDLSAKTEANMGGIDQKVKGTDSYPVTQNSNVTTASTTSAAAAAQATPSAAIRIVQSAALVQCSYCNRVGHEALICKKWKYDHLLCMYCNLRGHEYADCYELGNDIGSGALFKKLPEETIRQIKERGENNEFKYQGDYNRRNKRGDRINDNRRNNNNNSNRNNDNNDGRNYRGNNNNGDRGNNEGNRYYDNRDDNEHRSGNYANNNNNRGNYPENDNNRSFNNGINRNLNSNNEYRNNGDNNYNTYRGNNSNNYNGNRENKNNNNYNGNRRYGSNNNYGNNSNSRGYDRGNKGYRGNGNYGNSDRGREGYYNNDNSHSRGNNENYGGRSNRGNYDNNYSNNDERRNEQHSNTNSDQLPSVQPRSVTNEAAAPAQQTTQQIVAADPNIQTGNGNLNC